jgi:hypothetical protein
MGGQIMPPVMGAVAFIMAETLGVQYSEIVKAGGDSGHPVFRVLRSGWCIWKPASTASSA